MGGGGGDGRPDPGRPRPQHAARDTRCRGGEGRGTRRRGTLSVNVRPVAGYRFRGGAERDVSRVVAPPYDQIAEETQARLYAMSAWNIVRVSYPCDAPDADRDTGARRTPAARRAPRAG